MEMIGLICAQCGNSFETQKAEWRKRHTNREQRNFFCNLSCAGKFHSKTENKKSSKEINCKYCGVLFWVKKNAIVKAQCDKCRRKAKDDRRKPDKLIFTKIRYRNCKVCQILFVAKLEGRVHCKLCLSLKHQERAIKNIHRMGDRRRSKNEILFAEKLRLKLPNDLITINNPFFKDVNGIKRDADIILHDRKLAIHWNGIWHYKNVLPGHSALVTGKRDSKKYKAIENAGYTNYIIKDLKGFDEKKVDQELAILLDHLSLVKY